jgi:hypothetical protein
MSRRTAPIVTWKGGDRRQMTIGMPHETYAAFDAIAARHNLDKGALARIVIEAAVRDPAGVAAMLATRGGLPVPR